jgi:hypothetical protein
VKRANKKAVRMIETSHKSQCFFNRDNLLYVQAARKASKKAIPFCNNDKANLKALTTLQATENIFGQFVGFFFKRF